VVGRTYRYDANGNQAFSDYYQNGINLSLLMEEVALEFKGQYTYSEFKGQYTYSSRGSEMGIGILSPEL